MPILTHTLYTSIYKSLRSSYRTIKGFTLIELMITVSVIAILGSIGVSFFTSAQKNARDARRRGDINTIAQAMEIHYNQVTKSRYSGVCFNGGSDYDCMKWFGDATTATSMPLDPSKGIRYYYCVDSTCSGASNPPQISRGNGNITPWYFCATLEKIPSVVSSLINGDSTSTQFYCKTNDQNKN